MIGAPRGQPDGDSRQRPRDRLTSSANAAVVKVSLDIERGNGEARYTAYSISTILSISIHGYMCGYDMFESVTSVHVPLPDYIVTAGGLWELSARAGPNDSPSQ